MNIINKGVFFLNKDGARLLRHPVYNNIIVIKDGSSRKRLCRSDLHLKQIGEKAQEKKCNVCGFYGPGEGI